MKHIILILLAVCFSFTLSAQTSPKLITVKGATVDSLTKKPLDFVTVALQDPKTKLAVKSSLTKEDGSFELSAPAGKTYQLVLAFIGYNTKLINITDTTGNTDVGNVPLSASNKTLNEVSITAVKPLMKREADRLTYDVQADPESKTITALDMMRKVPLLSVDATDNIKLRGTGNYKILINGKESALMAKNPSDILKAMPATNILKIEVITTPPAKYDAEGLSGIINIITKKNADQGYNGSVNTSYNTVYGYRANLNFTIKQGKVGYNGYVGHGDRKAMSSDFENGSSFFAPGTTNVVTSLLQNGTRFNGNNNTYTGNELSFEIDSLNLFTGTFNLYNGNGTQGNNQFTVQRDANQAVTQNYNLFNNGTSDFKGSDIGLNYQLGFKRNKDQLLTVSYKYNNSENKQFNNVTSNHGLGYTAPDFRQYNNSGSKEYTTQLDYVHPMKMVTIEAGGKMILRNNYSDFRNDILTGGQYVTDPNQSNDFTYHQNVYGLYNSYLLKLAEWTFKGGLRLERTTVNTDVSTANQSYNNLVPSFSTQRNLNKTSSVSFGFTQRIQRPGIYQLNPFTDKSNAQYITVGNPGLRPAVNNNFELGYSNFAKGSVNISANYTFANNTIQNVSSVNNAVTTTTFANVGKNKGLGVDVNINYPITKELNVNINAELLQVWLTGTYNNNFYTNSGQQGHIFTFTTYKFNNGLRMGVNIGFDSRYVLLQGRDNYYFFSSYSTSKDFFKGKLNVNLAINNPFSKFNKLDFFTKTPDFQTYNTNMNYYRTINLGLNYKFGKLNSTIKKNQRGINNDDTKNDSK